MTMRGKLYSDCCPRQKRKASALVIVLASLAFLAALLLAFLSSVGRELKSTKLYAEGVTVQLLAQSAFNVAQIQVAAATRGVDGVGAPLAWASQPGMIRTYNNTGAKDRFFRLYSWDLLSGTGDFDVSDEKSELDEWDKKKAIFTDLNEPVLIGAERTYPIVDGNGLDTVAGVPGKTYKANGVQAIEGFYVDTGAAPASAAGGNPVPMPVKWLYVLQDGQIVSAAATAKENEARIEEASSSNPIVGRVAFWTDDESCKVNLNTAGDGFSFKSGNSYRTTYWDTPRFNNDQDKNLANNQPVNNEFQRYPGHPASVALSTIFKKTSSISDQAWAEEIYKIVPRVKHGGSAGGSVKTTEQAFGTVTLAPDSDRLFASVDELLFKGDMAVPAGGSRTVNTPGASSTVINKATLDRAKFFLTVSSRSPDLNLFNKPRICIWPVNVNTGPTARTPYDELIAFCSTVGRSIYYFQRQNPASASNDLPASLPDGVTDRGLKNNRRLLNYEASLTSQNIPGFGGNFLAKYGVKDRNQILTEIFDYIRCTNLKDMSTSQIVALTPTTPQTGGGGVVVPIVDSVSGTRGFGRFPTVQQAFLHFIAEDNSGVSTIPAGQKRVEAGFFIQLYDPSQGYSCTWPNFRIRITGLQGFTWSRADGTESTNMGFTSDAMMRPTNFYGNFATYSGGLIQYTQWARNQIFPPDEYNFISVSKLFPDSPGHFKFTGGDIKIELCSSTGTVYQTVILNFPSADFPLPNVVTPRVLTSSYDPPVNSRSFKAKVDPKGRIAHGAAEPAGNWIRTQDVVRAVLAVPGDIRMLSPRESIGTSDGFFAPHPGYFDLGKRMAHNIRLTMGATYEGASPGRLVDIGYSGSISGDNTYGYMAKPRDSDVVLGTAGVALGKIAPFVAGDLPGDWDNGFGSTPDGPYINKADEGSVGKIDDGAGDPYYPEASAAGNVGQALFTPNKMVASAVTFGSLPSQVWANKPWQTLHFRPGPAGHPGLASPKDHLLLDLYQMPVVEPYAISEPLSTAGRINMNYQIVPFSYIHRDTGIRAVLKNEKVIAVPDASTNYKSGAGTTFFRLDVDAGQTLEGFRKRFEEEKDIFRSATEICDIHIVPSGATYADMPTYWNTRRLTGDNSRERPYATVYPRLTTRSNTFTIHARVQTLKKIKKDDPKIWTEGFDQVTGQYRGHQTIERYIDPNEAGLPDFADPAVTTPISNFYRTRVLTMKQFAN